MESGQGGAAIVPGVVSGQFQFGFSNFTSLLIVQTKNVPIKVVANGVASTGVTGKDFGGVTVKKDSPIKTAADKLKSDTGAATKAAKKQKEG